MVAINEPKHGAAADLVANLGGRENICHEITQYRQLVAEMTRRFPDFEKNHPEKWVSLAKGGVCLVGDSPESIFEQMDRQGIPRASSIVKFVASHERQMIL